MSAPRPDPHQFKTTAFMTASRGQGPVIRYQLSVHGQRTEIEIVFRKIVGDGNSEVFCAARRRDGLPEESYKEMQEIAEKENLPLTHVLRRAIKTEQFIKDQEKQGNKILIDDGKSLSDWSGFK